MEPTRCRCLPSSTYILARGSSSPNPKIRKNPPQTLAYISWSILLHLRIWIARLLCKYLLLQGYALHTSTMCICTKRFMQHTAPFWQHLLHHTIVTSASFKDSLFTKVEGGKSDIQYSSPPISYRSPHETIFHSLRCLGVIQRRSHISMMWGHKQLASFVPLNAGSQ